MEPLDEEWEKKMLNIGTQRVIGKILLLSSLYGNVRHLEQENQSPDQMSLARDILKQASENVWEDLNELFERHQNPVFRKVRNSISYASDFIDDMNYVEGIKVTSEGFKDLTDMLEKKVFSC